MNDLGGFQPRFSRHPHLAEVFPVISFAGFQFVEKHLIDSRSKFLRGLSLLLDIISSNDSLLFQDREGFQRHIKTAVDSAWLRR